MASSSERGYAFPCFKDKVVVVTGASSGIGEAVAIEFAKDGAKLALTGRNAERLDAVSQMCIKQGIPSDNVLQMIGDVTDNAFIEKFIDETVTKLGGVDVLVNNAGNTPEFGSPGVFDTALLYVNFNVYVAPLYTFIRCCMPHLKKSKGSIINNSSIYGHVMASSPLREYSVCKSAVTHLTANLAYELAQDGVRINSVSPGVTRTPAFEKTIDSAEAIETVIAVSGKKSGFNRIGKSEEVASVVQFLASPAASYVTGADLVVDGGQTKLPFLLPEQFM